MLLRPAVPMLLLASDEEKMVLWGERLMLLLPTVPMLSLASDEENSSWGGILMLLLSAVPMPPSVPDEENSFVGRNVDVAAFRSSHAPISS